jgi:hypothetical protein
LDEIVAAEEYFAMIVLILIALTFIAFFLLFLYMVYGETKEGVRSKNVAFLKNIQGSILLWPLKITSL